MHRPRYDVFLSHATPDKPVVVELARILRMQGIEPWLDVWNLIPGEPWQEAIEEALESCATCAVCIGPSGTGPWQNEEMRAAIERRVKEKRFRVIPVLLPNSVRGEPSRLPPFLRSTGWIEFRKTLDDEKALHRLIAGIRGVQPGPGPGEAVAEGAQPYRGLEVFDVGDAPFFFGREALTEWLLEKLRPVPNSSRFLAIFGPSGSGKSSLARAGLLAAVKRGEIAGSDSWLTTVFKPGEQPLEALAAHLTALGGFPPVLELHQALAANKRSLHLNARVALAGAPADRRLLIVVDQFEEVFTLCSDEIQRTAFIDNLLHAAMAAGGPTVIVLTLRADFYGRCAAYPDLAAAVSDRQTLVGPMTPDELRRAIERPAYLAGCELEGGLTDLLLKEVETQPGCLPLLEYALLQTWQHREGRRLTTDAYNEIHGIAGALEKRAEEVYATLTEAEGEVCRRVFLRLVQVDEQGRATKRRRRLAELTPETEPDHKATESVIARFTDARLLIAAAEGDEKRPTLELAHEALLTGWKRLADWIEQNRESLQTRRRLDEAVTEWLGNDKDPSFFYRGARLAQAEEWAGSHPGEPSSEAKEFLAASRAQEEQEAQRELAQARALEEEQRRRAEEQLRARQRLKKWTIAFAAMAVAAAVAFGIALFQYRDLENQRNITLATELGKHSKEIAQNDPSLALLLSIEAVRRAEKAGQPHLPAAEETLRAALIEFRGAPLPTGKVRAISFSADRQWLVVAGTNGEISLWHHTDQGPIKTASIAKPKSNLLKDIAVSSGGRWVFTSFQDSPSTLFRVDLKKGSLLNHAELPGEDWLSRNDPFSSDGHWLLTRRSGQWVLRDLTLSAVSEIMTLDSDFQAVAFSPDGRWLAVADKGGVRVGDMSTIRTRLAFRQAPGGEIWGNHQIAFTSDSQWLVETSSVRSVQAWRLRPDQDIAPPIRFEACAPVYPEGLSLEDPSLSILQKVWGGLCLSRILPVDLMPAIALDPGMKKVAIAAKRDSQPSSPVSLSILSRALFEHWSLLRLFALQGRWLIMQTGDEPPRVFDVQHGIQNLIEPVALSAPKAETISPDGWRLNLDFPVRRLWGPQGPQPIPGSNWTGPHWIFSRDGRWLAAVTFDRRPLAWQVREDGKVSSPILFSPGYQHSQDLTDLAFSPDGRWLATGDKAGKSRLWDLQNSQREPRELTKHSRQVTALAFSNDGHLIATAGAEGAVYLRELNENPALHDLPDAPAAGRQPITGLAFLQDGRLAISDSGPRLRLWEPGHQEVELDAGGDSISSLASSPQGDRLASPEAIWSLDPRDLRSRPVLLPPIPTRSPLPSKVVAFTRDGHGLWFLRDGSLFRFELRTDKLLATACRAVGRNLTEKEWRAYLPAESYQEREPCPGFPKAFD